jgi:hypothetical protein
MQAAKNYGRLRTYLLRRRAFSDVDRQDNDRS